MFLFEQPYLILLRGGGLGLLSRGHGGRLGRLALLGKKNGVDVGENTTLGDGHTAQQLVELLVVADGQLDVAGHDTGLLVVPSGVASELKDFSSQVLKHGGEVHGGTSSDAGSEAAALEESANAANGKLQTSLGAAAHALL
jgi:hypothetical protein